MIRSLALGGAERQFCLLAQGLLARGHQVSVLSFYPGGTLEAQLKTAGVPLVELAKGGRWDLLGFARRVRRWLRRERPQVLYSFLDTPNLLAAWLKPLCPGLKVAWGVRASDMDLKRYDWFARLSHRLLDFSARGADLVIVNSRAGAGILARRGLAAAKLKVIPNGLDVAAFTPDPAAGAGLRAQWGVGPQAPLLGLVARLDPMKDHPTFLRAAASLLPRFPGLRLVCVGGGPAGLARELKALAEELGLGQALVWAGQRRDMPAVMNALDVCVLSSAFGEGFPNVLGEAMACAKPCVVTAVGDAAWVLGRPELVAPPGQPEALAQRLAGLLEMPVAQRAALGASLRARVVEEFSLERMIARSEQALMDLAAGRGVAAT